MQPSSLRAGLRNFALLLVISTSSLLGKPAFAPRSVVDRVVTSPALRTGARSASAIPPAGFRPVGLQGPAAVQALQHTIFFERNDGQADRQVLYLARSFGYSVFLTRNGFTVVLPEDRDKRTEAAKSEPHYFRLQFASANPHSKVTGIEELPSKSNYFSTSDPKLWHTDIPQFAKVRYRNLYPGVDVLIYARDGQLEYDIVAAPGANLGAIHIKELGTKPQFTLDGDISLHFGKQRFTLKKPRVLQFEPQRRIVPARYVLRGNDLYFQVGSYDRSRSITVDPALIFSTYLNSNCPQLPGVSGCVDTVTDIAADATGIYLTGSTQAASFPATSAKPTSMFQGPQSQTYVLKIGPDGSSILFVNYLSSSFGLSIAVDPTGSAYVVGDAYVGYPGLPAFPLTPGAFSGVIPSNSSQATLAYATKFSASGSTLEYSTFLQPSGSGSTTSYAIPAKVAVDSTGALYIAGTSDFYTNRSSTWLPLPTSVGGFQTSPGSIFVMKLTPSGSGLDYSTYIDGNSSTGVTGSELAAGIAVNASGNAFVTGTTGPGFPTTAGAYETTSQLGAFVTELNPGGTAQVYSTYFNSTAVPGAVFESLGIAIDSSDEAVIVGSGYSPPVTSNAFCGTSANSRSGFIAKFNSTGSDLVYSSTVCGDSAGADAVALDSTGAAYVTGWTADPATFQPILVQPIQNYLTPSTSQPLPAQQIALKFDTSGTLLWATFLGLTNEAPSHPGVAPSRIAIDPNLNAYILYGPAAQFPTTPNTVGLTTPGTSSNAGDDFLLKIAPELGAPVPLASPTSGSFPAENVGISSTPVDVQLGNYGDAPGLPTLTVTGDFSETDDCASGVPAGSKCDVNVVFTPTAGGTRNGVLTFAFGGSISPVTVPLTGVGTAPAVTLSPTSLSFGVQPTGTTSAAQQVTITNSGTSQLSILSIQTTAQFAATNSCGQPIAPANSCTISVTFTPSVSGVQTGTLTITDNASNSPQTVALAGNQPASFSISTSSSNATVTPGQTANYSLSLAGTNGFNGSVSFTCSGAPAGAMCSVSPNPANVSGQSPVAISVAVTTQAASLTGPVGPNPSRSQTGSHNLGWAALVLVLLTWRFVQQGKRKWIPAGLAILVWATTFVGCGGKSSQSQLSQPGTPTGQYMITVTGTSGSITQSMELALTLN